MKKQESHDFSYRSIRNLVVTQEIWKEDNMYTAYCPELDIASCGSDIEEAQKRKR